MPDLKPITIVGGGLAGLGLGIALRQREVPVTVWEASDYPRHRVCGEFICGRGQETLERLGLQDPIVRAGGRWARSAAFYAPRMRAIHEHLPQAALCISRYVLDNLLAEEYRRLGGELQLRQRASLNPLGEGTVRTTGRRLQAVVQGWRWFGLKVHARAVALKADLEMHLVPDGYVGLCLLNGEVNVCGLFRSRTALPDLKERWREILRGSQESELHGHLRDALFDDDSFCAVAGLDLTPRRATEGGECALGDALTMTPPFTGNGMSMAFESAELAVEPLSRYSRGEIAWDRAQSWIAAECNLRFRSRLRTAGLLQRSLFHPLATKVFFSGMARCSLLLRWLFWQTR